MNLGAMVYQEIGPLKKRYLKAIYWVGFNSYSWKMIRMSGNSFIHLKTRGCWSGQGVNQRSSALELTSWAYHEPGGVGFVLKANQRWSQNLASLSDHVREYVRELLTMGLNMLNLPSTLSWWSTEYLKKSRNHWVIMIIIEEEEDEEEEEVKKEEEENVS